MCCLHVPQRDPLEGSHEHRQAIAQVQSSSRTCSPLSCPQKVQYIPVCTIQYAQLCIAKSTVCTTLQTH